MISLLPYPGIFKKIEESVKIQHRIITEWHFDNHILDTSHPPTSILSNLSLLNLFICNFPLFPFETLELVSNSSHPTSMGKL